MASLQDERMDALTESIVRLLRRQDEAERRMARIEEALALSPIGAAEPVAPPPPSGPPVIRPEPPPVPEAPPSLVAPETVAPETPAPVAAAAEPAPRQLETRLGLTWVNRIGVVTFVLGVAFFFKYAIDQHWLGEWGRVLMGVLAGIAALAAADRTWRGGQRIYAQGISAVGVSILYLSFYAAFSLYHLTSIGAAFGLMFLTTLVAVELALRYGAMPMAALGFAGGYITPVALSTGQDAPWFVFSYLLLLNAGAMFLARNHRWRTLEWIGEPASAALWIGWYSDKFVPSHRLVGTLFPLLYYAIFAGFGIRPIAIVSQFLTLAAIASVWAPEVPTYMLLSLAMVGCGFVLAEIRCRPGLVIAAFAGLWTGFGIWYNLVRGIRPDLAIFLFLSAAFLLFFFWTPWRVLMRKQEVRKIGLLLIVLNGGMYYGVCYALFEPQHRAWMGLLAFVLALVHMAPAKLLWNATDQAARPDSRAALLLLGVAWSFLTLAAPVQLSGYRITMAWAIEGAGLAWIGARAAERRLICAALAVFVLTIGRLFSVDQFLFRPGDAYTTLANPRFWTFVITAACLWASAQWMLWKKVALVAYVAGHYVLLWSLGLEVVGWCARNILPDEAQSVVSTSISILMAAYAVMLVSIGVYRRSMPDRLMGLGLIALVVAKLYLYDVWLLRVVYRMAAFAGLGALLLLMSYLYSRYRLSIENWWRDQKPAA